jgi:transcriptional regulator with XRE-family HTH domain
MKNRQNPNKTLGNRVKALREAAKLTQEQLAEQLHFSAKYIGDLENARRNITPQTAELMANLFRCDANYLLDETVEYKTAVDKFNAVLDEPSHENYLMFNAICSLAALNGYDVEIQDIHGSGKIEDVFSRMKEFMIFKRNGKKEFSLSLADANRFGNNLSEIFMSNIKWNIKTK